MHYSTALPRPQLFASILQKAELITYTEYVEKIPTIVSFCSHVTERARRIGSKSNDHILNVCFKVLNILVSLEYLRTTKFKKPFRYHGYVVPNYVPTTTYPDLLKEGFVLEVPNEIQSTDELLNSQKLSSEQHSEKIKVTTMYLHLMNSAFKRGKDFDLTYTDVKRLIERKTCFYTGIRFSLQNGSPFTRTVDRVDASKGYVKGNVVASSSFANSLKNQLMENGGVSKPLPRKAIKQMLSKFLQAMETIDEQD